MTSHRFRFFSDTSGSTGDSVELSPPDAAHARVLRLGPADVVDVVTGQGALYEAAVELVDEHAVVLRLGAMRSGAGEGWSIELLAGVLTGGTFDELVDGAVQAGVTRLVPVASTRRELERIEGRAQRLERVATAAAKQAKRLVVPELAPPILLQSLVDQPGGAPGIVLDARAATTLAAAVAACSDASPSTAVRLLVGPSEGLDAALVEALVQQGWQAARLGPTVLRSELAAAVAVAHVAALLAGDG